MWFEFRKMNYLWKGKGIDRGIMGDIIEVRWVFNKKIYKVYRNENFVIVKFCILYVNWKNLLKVIKGKVFCFYIIFFIGK